MNHPIVLFRPDLSFRVWTERRLTQWVFVVWGRSNVGKSTFINTITHRKQIAYTSKTPGKTQSIHFYEVVPARYYLVDLPGYGYARLSQHQRQQFTKQTVAFLTSQTIKKHVLVLIDSRLNWQANDQLVLEQLQNWQIPFSIILSKVDKITLWQRQVKYRESLTWTPRVFYFSNRSPKLHHLTKLQTFLETWVQEH